MEFADLTKDSMKFLGINFSYNKNIESEENFIKIIKKIENAHKIWRTRNLIVQGKIKKNSQNKTLYPLYFIWKQWS